MRQRMLGWDDEGSGVTRLELDGAVGSVSVGDDGAVRLRACWGSSLPPDPAPGIGRPAWRAESAWARAEAGGAVLACGNADGDTELSLRLGPLALLARHGEAGAFAMLSDLELEPDGAARITLALRPGDRVFGFGERAGGLEQTGRRVLLRTRDAGPAAGNPLYAAIPFFLVMTSLQGRSWAYGVLLDAYGRSEFDVGAGKADRLIASSFTDGLDLTLFPGPSPAQVLGRYTARTGRTPVPPRWALGHHQSRWGYRDEADVRRVAAELRGRDMPTDVIHLDIDYMRGYRVFTWDHRRFPDPRRVVQELRASGLRAVAIVDPGVKADRDWELFRDGEARDLYCRRADGRLYTLRVWPGRSVLPDFNRVEAREWWGRQHQALLEAGIAGIWNDMNEPAGWAADLRLGRRIVQLRPQDLSRVEQAWVDGGAERVDHERVRCVYALQECRATRAALEAAAPGRRAFVLTRSGYAGIQSQAAMWTGDNASRWEDLRESVPMLLNLSLSGVAFCGADIGGFAGDCSPELYARWIQLGALYPFARTHSDWRSRSQEPWSFGERVEAIAREALRLRMRLMPYIHGLYHACEATGSPVWRPLFYEYPDDPGSLDVEDQVMLGPQLMLAPVLEAGARGREVYIPPGRWFGWDDDRLWEGPARVWIDAPLERLPLFVRAGAALATCAPQLHADQPSAEPCVIEVFPGEDGTGELIEDDGETLDYRQGRVARTAFRLTIAADGTVRLEIGARRGAWRPEARRMRIVLHACPSPQEVVLDGTALPERQTGAVAGYGWNSGRLQVGLEDDGQAHSLEVRAAE